MKVLVAVLVILAPFVTPQEEEAEFPFEEAPFLPAENLFREVITFLEVEVRPGVFIPGEQYFDLTPNPDDHLWTVDLIDTNPTLPTQPVNFVFLGPDEHTQYHMHSWVQLNVITEGVGIAVLDGKQLEDEDGNVKVFKPGDIIVVPAGVCHSFVAPPNSEFRLAAAFPDHAGRPLLCNEQLPDDVFNVNNLDFSHDPSDVIGTNGNGPFPEAPFLPSQDDFMSDVTFLGDVEVRPNVFIPGEQYFDLTPNPDDRLWTVNLLNTDPNLPPQPVNFVFLGEQDFTQYHMHSWVQLNVITLGSGIAILDGQPLTNDDGTVKVFGVGDVIIVPEGVCHSFVSMSTGEFRLAAAFPDHAGRPLLCDNLNLFDPDVLDGIFEMAEEAQMEEAQMEEAQMEEGHAMEEEAQQAEEMEMGNNEGRPVGGGVPGEDFVIVKPGTVPVDCLDCIQLDVNHISAWCPDANAQDRSTDGTCVSIHDFCPTGLVQSASLCDTAFQEVPAEDPRPDNCLDCVSLSTNTKLGWCADTNTCISLVDGGCARLIQSQSLCPF